MITVALIDDHLIVRSGFAQLLGLEPDLQVVAEFGSGREALAGLPGREALAGLPGREALAGLPGRGVQVCICDISMPDISGLELLSQLPKGMATIMLSVHDSPALVEQALNAGARGFLSKRCSPDELIAAVHTVATGGCYLTPDIAIKLASGRQDPLTKRERQVAEKLAQGMAVKEIAAELGLSPKTVHVHRANLMEKLGVSNDVELARCMFDGW
ncbi:TPA: transcriptional regulator UhpA [Escherichia coli]|nr:transcriptional regulator UhpA [Escherichia coli]